ncbi:MAG: hypothetical protein F6K17_16180 [Okeania sp. SIO3C4]|nr:hypothetical protein [Okeania sp. SIO3C4]
MVSLSAIQFFLSVRSQKLEVRSQESGGEKEYGKKVGKYSPPPYLLISFK